MRRGRREARCRLGPAPMRGEPSTCRYRCMAMPSRTPLCCGANESLIGASIYEWTRACRFGKACDISLKRATRALFSRSELLPKDLQPEEGRVFEPPFDLAEERDFGD